MNEYPKDILFDIDMQLYDEFNDKIATMNDHLGDIYSLRDVEEVEKAEKEKEIQLLRKAVKEQSQQIEYLNCIVESDKDNYISKTNIENIIKAKIEEYEEKFKAENGKKTINYHLYRIIIDEVLKPLLDKIKGDDK